MKRLLLLLTILGFVFTACESGNEIEEDNGIVPSIPQIELSQGIIDVEFESNTYTISVSSPYSWKAESDNEWLIVESKTGIAGSESLVFKVERNEEVKERKGTIVLSNSNYNLIAELYVIQKAFSPSEIVIDPEILSFTTEGGAQDVEITTNFEYEVTTDANWLTIERKTNGISITASAYFEVEERTAEIIVLNEKYGISKTINIIQSAFVPEITIEQESLNYTKLGGEQEIKVKANFEHIAKTEADWIDISKKGDIYSIVAEINTTTEIRSAEISVLSEKYGISKAIKVTQDEASEVDFEMAEISVSPTSFVIDLNGGEQIITITSNATWTVSCSGASIEPRTGNGNGQVTITVPAASAREFKVVFDAQKQTLIPALGTSTTTTAKADIVVSQNPGGINWLTPLYYEDCGEDVEKNSEGYWPYVDAFEGWNPQGDAATGVAYKGTQASVRASGNAYQPTTDAVDISGQPYVFLNKVPASAYFVIENIAVTGGSNYIFTYNVQCQSGYSGSPTFATVDGSLVHLELGYDGVNWDAVECTYTPNGGNGWYAAQTEFKVAADATKLYARFTYEAPASNGGGRFDDFKLVAGGNGAELTPSAPVVPEQPEGGETPEPEQPGGETPEVPVIPEGGTVIEFTTDSVKAAIPDITTNGYGSQNVTSYSTFLTWDVFAACKLCLPPAGDYATANCLQMQGNTDAAKQGRVGNVVATPKRITKIIVESYNAKYTPNFNLALGTEQVVGTSVPANMIPASSMTTSSVVEGALTKYVSTYEVTSGDYTYFAIYKNTTGAFYFSKIRVEYAE